MEICYYDKSLERAAVILTKLREDYPKLAGFFCVRWLLIFL